MRSPHRTSWALFITLAVGLSASCTDDAALEPDDATSDGEPECGNGIVEAGEVCDDAGESATCNADCTPSVCGDGVRNATADEHCDDAGESATCNYDCTPATCGDGVINVQAGEECDDHVPSETCADDCTLVPCEDDPGGCAGLPAAPVLTLGLSPIKRFDFAWAQISGAGHYRLLESASPGAPYVQLGEAVTSGPVSVEVPLHLREDARYVLSACSEAGCTDSEAVTVTGSLVDAVGYVKASNTGASDAFGRFVALSADGNTLAVGAPNEDGGAAGIGGDQASDDITDAGAVYVLVRDDAGVWAQQAYVKASNPGESDGFGGCVALSADGRTLVVGAMREDGSAAGIDGNEASNTASNAGAAYVFVRDDAGAWSQQAYVKASNPGADDLFGERLALSADGDTLAVTAVGEDANGSGTADISPNSGAAYVFVRDDAGAWSQQAYVKASNSGPYDSFGMSVALAGDGNTLAVGAFHEDGSPSGFGGDHGNALDDSGAVYVLTRDEQGAWSQQAYLKASNADEQDQFGFSVALSADGSTLAVGANLEASSATGIDGDQDDDGAPWAGAAYVFVRSGAGAWSQHAYVKAPNTAARDLFGQSVALSGDGSVLAVHATAAFVGSVYVFARDDQGTWSQRAHLGSPSGSASSDFGTGIALSGDGRTLAVGADEEDSSATGIGGDQFDDSAPNAGAVYLY